MQEPNLIDDILAKRKLLFNNKRNICGVEYISKPFPYYDQHKILTRIYHAWLVLIGNASAWQFAEDSHKLKRFIV